MYEVLAPIILVLAVVAAASLIYHSLKNGITPMPTSPKVKDKLNSLTLPLQQGVIYELGSGWGGLAFTLARKYPSHTVVAIESSTVPYLFCRLRRYLFPQANLHFIRQNFHGISLSDAALIVCYLYPMAMEKLKLKFDRELGEGVFIISNTFAIRGYSPFAEVYVDDLYHTCIYIYKIRLSGPLQHSLGKKKSRRGDAEERGEYREKF